MKREVVSFRRVFRVLDQLPRSNLTEMRSKKVFASFFYLKSVRFELQKRVSTQNNCLIQTRLTTLILCKSVQWFLSNNDLKIRFFLFSERLRDSLNLEGSSFHHRQGAINIYQRM
jgi:hypothetical protein